MEGRRFNVVWSVGIFLTWTLTSYLCHLFAKSFLTQALNVKVIPGELSTSLFLQRIFHATVLTVIQIGLCYTLTTVNNSDGSKNLLILRLCHIVATWFTNISMAFTFASSTFAIKLMEPITSAVVQYSVLGAPLSPMAICSLPIIVVGAVAFSGNPVTQRNLSYGIVSAFFSNIVLAFRNVTIKSRSVNRGDAAISLRRVSPSVLTTLGLFGTGLGIAYSQSYISGRTIAVIATGFSSGLFHVIYSYVSTGIVLAHLSVVSHAVTNILKRLLVVLLLYVTGSRVASFTNFSGLAICTLGLMIYAWSKREKSTTVIGTYQSFGLSSELKVRLRNFIYIFGLLMTGMCLGVMKDTVLTPDNSLQWFQDVAGLANRHLPQNLDSSWERTFNEKAHDLPSKEDLQPQLEGFSSEMFDIQTFLDEDLHANPNRSGYLSRQLRTSSEVIKEAQRLHFDILARELSGFKYAMLLDIASFENKGDPCITVGEIYFLARIKLEIIYYCSTASCNDKSLSAAAEKAKQFSPKELVILGHGGGNIVGYAFSDIHRFQIIKLFKGYKIFIFPQSTWIKNVDHSHVKRCAAEYCCNENLTIVMRDQVSYSHAIKHFNGGDTKFLMAPDMAFQIGTIKRFASPVFDIMWIKRADGETPGYGVKDLPAPPPGLRVHVSDWWKWITPSAPSSLEKAFYICTNGFFYLQRGRVVITDRLHGHILSTLLDIPHVLIDNKAHKLSAYDTTWTAGLDKTVITDDPTKAMQLAVELLNRYNNSVPPRIPFLNIDETHGTSREFDKVDDSYI